MDKHPSTVPSLIIAAGHFVEFLQAALIGREEIAGMGGRDTIVGGFLTGDTRDANDAH